MERCIDHFTLPENPVLDKDRADGQCGDDLYWKLVNNTLHIFGTGEMYPWAWSRYFPLDCTTVDIHPGCTKIGFHAFDPKALDDVAWDSEDWTEDDPFMLLHPSSWDFERQEQPERNLKFVFIPHTVKEIGDGAFQNCKSSSGEIYVIMQSGVEKIGRNAFRMSDVYEIDIPDSVKEIGKNVFSMCEELSVLGIGMKNIPAHAFRDLENLWILSLKEGVETIGEEAFANCGIDHGWFPSTLKEIGEGAFRDCSKLKYMDLSCVEKIGDMAFENCGLQSIDIPNSVKEIGKLAFKGDYRDICVEIPDSVKEIGENAFWGIEELIYDGPACSENMWGAWILNDLHRPRT